MTSEPGGWGMGSHSFTQSAIQNILTMGPWWWTNAGHLVAPCCPDELSPQGGGARSSCSVTAAGVQIKKKFERQTSEETEEEQSWRGDYKFSMSRRVAQPLALRHLLSPPWRAHNITASQLSGRPSTGRRGGGPPANSVVPQHPHAAFFPRAT